MNLGRCHNFHDFQRLAKARLPGPVFDYIEGAADDEATFRRNTEAYEKCDLVPNVLADVDRIDMSVTVMGQQRSKWAGYFSPERRAFERVIRSPGCLTDQMSQEPLQIPAFRLTQRR